MNTTDPTTEDQDQEAAAKVATMRSELEAVAGLLPPETAAQMAELLDHLEAGTVTEEEAAAKAEQLYAGMLGTISELAPGLDPSALGLPAQLDQAPPPPIAIPGLAVAEELARAELAGQPVTLTPQAAGELAELASFALYMRDQAWPVLDGLRPLVDRISQVGPQLQEAGPVQLVQLIVQGLQARR
jgi:hypothetical protein